MNNICKKQEMQGNVNNAPKTQRYTTLKTHMVKFTIKFKKPYQS